MSVVLDIASELVFPDIACVGTVTHATLPIHSRSTTPVSVTVHADCLMVDGVVSSANDRYFLVTQHSFLLSVAASHNLQVFHCLYSHYCAI